MISGVGDEVLNPRLVRSGLIVGSVLPSDDRAKKIIRQIEPFVVSVWREVRHGGGELYVAARDLERATGIEPATLSLGSSDSTN